MANPNATGLINTDFQNADDIWVVLLTGKFRVFGLTGTMDDLIFIWRSRTVRNVS
ncbi:hypothetical protein [Chamaesiphon sp. OTE_20_metabat_361]|uniref:hypothetical protein n=1 Tax=Chamaesiphon sp. OTE_20_metabat_361 TaxID=2964689 RepID=UPI00286C9C81|nr:hypothetical protein [Chamaesiphon sp. OTE_20_metabat_361]